LHCSIWGGGKIGQAHCHACRALMACKEGRPSFCEQKEAKNFLSNEVYALSATPKPQGE
jgi:hypothetical protein